jgi:hypothetical protein
VVALREDVELMDKRPAERCLFNKGWKAVFQRIYRLKFFEIQPFVH